MTAPLNGLRVLDFGRYIAGPYCGALLADLGAEVIRIERIEGGEDRFGQYPMNEEGIGATFVALGRNKKGMTLDPMHSRAAEILKPLIATADIIVANLPSNVMRRMGIDYETVSAFKPGIIVTAIAGFNERGPYADRVGLDGVAQAMSGAAYMSGDPGNPTKAFPPWIDVLAGTFAAFGTVAAVHHRSLTGQGQQVNADLLSTGVAGMSWLHTEQAATGINRSADGSKTQSSSPGDIFRTKDGWFLMQTIGPFLFERWAQLMGEKEQWLSDPRFKNDTTRSAHRHVLSERTQRWAINFTNEEALQKMAAARIPCGPVLSPQQLLDDPHVQQTGMFRDVPYPGLKTPAKVMEHPLRFSHVDTEFRLRPPTLGEHTDQILSELGFSADRIAELRHERVI